MFESPVLQKLIAEKLHQFIRALVEARFGTVPADVARQLRAIHDEKKLRRLNVLAAKCSDLQAFRNGLASSTPRVRAMPE
jgi:hypothetical protein